MTGLEVIDLDVTYPGPPAVDAVRGASFAVKKGETVALLGPSGCGKSTLLGAIAGIIEPASGVVRWDGDDVTRLPVHERRFGLVFQDGQLFPHRDVAGNIAFGLEMARVAPATREARVTELLELVHLEAFRDRPVGELSGGERQRVALARALAPEPRVLLLDEPLSALDRELRDALAADVKDALAATHTTAILVTHDRADADAIATRTLHMRAGVVGRRVEKTKE